MDRAKHDGRLQQADPGVCWPEVPQLALPDFRPPTEIDSPPGQRMARLIRTLEAEIIPRLVQAHRPPAASPEAAAALEAGPASAEVEAFARLVLGNDDAAVTQKMLSLRERGVAVEAVYMELLAPAARHLGWMWSEDLCDFTDVTVGVGRLQQLMRELSSSFGRAIEHPADGRRILLMPARGEQHTFGLAMVADFFRRAGWEVVGGVGGDVDDPLRIVHREWFDIVGLSIGHRSRVAPVRQTIAELRERSRNRRVGIMVGGPLVVDEPDSAAALGADVLADNGAQAPALAEGLLDRRVRRL